MRSESDRRQRQRRAAKRRLAQKVVKGGSSILGPIAAAGAAAVEALEVIIEAANRKQEERFREEQEAQNRLIKKEIQKRNRDKQLRTTSMRRGRPVLGPNLPGELPQVGPPEGVLQVPSTVPARVESPVEATPRPDIEFPEPARPVPERPSPSIPTPTPPQVPGPVVAPSPAPAPRPAAIPGIGSQTGVFIGTAGAPLPATLPGAFPFFTGLPAQNPANLPQFVGRPATPIETLTPFETGVLDLPVPQPVPQAQTQRRCRPCKKCKEDDPKPREECFKGLYIEGPLDTEVDFIQWQQVDCFTGREI